MFVNQFISKMCKLSHLVFHLLQFCYFVFLFLGQASIALGDQNRYQGFPLKYLETKISLFLFSVTKLIGHP